MGIVFSGSYRTARELLGQAGALLKAVACGEPDENAELLLAHVLGKARMTLRAFPDFPVSESQAAVFSELIKRKAAGEPLAYITGRAPFLDLEFNVTPAVLIPRPETEQLALFALAYLKTRTAARVLDIGTGSGCLACALALKSDAAVAACDISAPALEAARANALRLGARVEFFNSDLFSGISGKFDLIVSNPPYIPSGELAALQPEVRREPAGALDGGPDGLAVFRRLAAEAPARLTPGGMLMLESACGQRAELKRLFSAAPWRAVSCRDDFAGLDRYVLAGI